MGAVDQSLLWDFNCRAERMPSGYYRVTITGSLSGDHYERTGYHPLWELIRLLGDKSRMPVDKPLPDCPGCIENDPGGTHSFGTKQHPEPEKGAEVQRWRMAVVSGDLLPLARASGDWVRYTDHAAALDAMRQRAERAEKIIADHDLCHNLHGKVDARAFADGCAAEQRKLYGCAPDADRAAKAEADLEEARGLLDRSKLTYLPQSPLRMQIDAFLSRTEKR